MHRTKSGACVCVYLVEKRKVACDRCGVGSTRVDTRGVERFLKSKLFVFDS